MIGLWEGNNNEKVKKVTTKNDIGAKVSSSSGAQKREKNRGKISRRFQTRHVVLIEVLL